MSSLLCIIFVWADGSGCQVLKFSRSGNKSPDKYSLQDQDKQQLISFFAIRFLWSKCIQIGQSQPSANRFCLPIPERFGICPAVTSGFARSSCNLWSLGFFLNTWTTLNLFYPNIIKATKKPIFPFWPDFLAGLKDNSLIQNLYLTVILVGVMWASLVLKSIFLNCARRYVVSLDTRK